MNTLRRSRRMAPAGLPRQQGISLFMVMMFLVILSILGITAIQSSTFSARIAGNEADRTLAFQAAEAALRDAEKDISCAACRPTPILDAVAPDDIFKTPCALGLCWPVLAPATPVWEDKATWTTANRAVTYGTYSAAAPLPVVAQQPQYIIEYYKLGIYEELVYRVTAIGYGANATTQVMLQTSVQGFTSK